MGATNSWWDRLQRSATRRPILFRTFIISIIVGMALLHLGTIALQDPPPYQLNPTESLDETARQLNENNEVSTTTALSESADTVATPSEIEESIATQSEIEEESTTVSSEVPEPTPTPTEPPTYRSKNKDPFLNRKPSEVKDLCNNLPTPRHPRGLFISHKTVDQPLKIFYWHQLNFGNRWTVDWIKEAKLLCPIPVSLQSFFNHYKIKRVDPITPNTEWPEGYIPCWFFTEAPTHFRQADVKKQCNTPNNGQLDYILSANYTTFEESDIVIIDYPFFDSIDEAPYFDTLTLPPRLTDQKWVFWFGGESLDYYPFVATTMYQNMFDLSIGSPPKLMDIPMPLYEITRKFALQLANIKPSFPFNKKPESYVGIMVSNCSPKNGRNELIHTLIDKAGAHSYGDCIHTTDMPEVYRLKPTDWGDWVNNKLKMLGNYPFVLAAENSSCMGYVTEKIYNALQAGAIPIYLGAADIADFVPEDSYVDASKFNDFEELVDYIKTVDRSKFYKWKEVVKNDPTKFCKSCFKVEDDPWCNVLKKVNFV